MINQDILRQGGDALRARAEALPHARFGPIVSRDFTMRELKAGLGRGAIQKWLRSSEHVEVYGRAIYRISAATQAGADALLAEFGRVQPNVSYSLPRLIPEHQGRTIYVGSSLKIAERLREHLQRASDATYALHLRRWCLTEDHVLRVELQAPADGVPNTVVQDAEDALWDFSQPRLGRRGAK